MGEREHAKERSTCIKYANYIPLRIETYFEINNLGFLLDPHLSILYSAGFFSYSEIERKRENISLLLINV